MTQGQWFLAIVGFANPSVDSNGLSRLRVDLELQRPDGTRRGIKSAPDWEGPPPARNILELTRNYLKIRMEAGDPLGTYTVVATLYDAVSGAKLSLSSPLEVIAGGAPPPAAASAAQPQQELPPAIKEYERFTTYYYTKPDLEKAQKVLLDLIQKENLEHPWYKGRESTFTLMAALLGDIGYGQERMVRFYESQFPGALPEGKHMIIRALQTCGDSETIKAVAKWQQQNGADAELQKDLTALARHLANPARKRGRDVPPKSPPDLDYLWVDFFATGEYAPVSRILDVFDLPDESGNVNLKRAARWSTQSNFRQHPRLIELVKEQLDRRPKGSQKAIEEMIQIAGSQ